MNLRGWFLVLLILVTACAFPSRTAQPNASSATDVVPPPAVTEPVSVPKQGDLLFIEFFAGT